MARPLLITLEKNNLPTLIIDKEGSIGLGLYAKFKDLFQVVMASGKKPEDLHNLLYFSYKHQIPQIPGDTYAQIFYVVHSAKELEELFPALSEKAKQDKGKFIIVGERNLLPFHVLEKIFSKDRECAVVILGEVFGNPLHHGQENLIEEIFRGAKMKKNLKLPALGLTKVYPVLFEDAVMELVRLSFTFNKKVRLYFLHTQYPMTLLGISHMIQKENPLLKIDFEKNVTEPKNDSIPIEGEYLLPEDYPAVEKLQKAFFSYKKKELEEEGSEQEPEITKINKIPNRMFSYIAKFTFFVLIFCIVLGVLPVISIGIFGFLGQRALQGSIQNIKNGNISSAKKQIGLVNQSLFFIKNSVPIAAIEFSWFKKNLFFNSILEKTQLAQTAISDANNLLQVSGNIQSFVKDGKKFSSDTLLESVANIKNLLITAEQVSADQSIPSSIKESIGNTLDNSMYIGNIIESMPFVFGVSSKKTYLVLFQNNAELRPGGGFVGSYGILTLNKGNISEFSIHDVYDTDGQLKGHVEPPFAIRRYLQVHLYLRDSNFDVDFTKSAFYAAFLYEQEMGHKVDGVIGTDLSFVRDIIGSVGKIYLPTYKEEVTKDNFFNLAEKYSEKDFFPGSSQKRDFLRDTFTSLTTQFTSGSGVNYLKLLQIISNASIQKHILFAFANSHAQDLFTVNGMSSSLWDNRVNSQDTINDFLGINEANIGVNKVNYFVTRKVNQNLNISPDGKIHEEVSLSLNNSSSGQWPGGGYKAYIRFILPQNSTLEKVRIDNVDQKIVSAITNPLQYEANNFIPPTGLEVERAEEGGKTLYGFLANIPPQKKQEIIISYTLEQKIDLTQPKLSYSLNYFKQPGTEEYPFSMIVSTPIGYKTLVTKGGLINQNTNVSFDQILTSDQNLEISFSKK